MPKKLGGRLEAKAKELSPRGFPYQIGETWMPVGDWVNVTHAQVEELDFLGWPVTVREKETPADGKPADG